jgi:SEC-C motif domain protein
MRSRYSAFVMRDAHYLLETWHPRTRPGSVEFNKDQQWLGLRIVSSKALAADAAEVEFIARYRIGGGSAARLHERSRFALVRERWFYVDGTFPTGVAQ